jgi:predicted adenylyl cyclase CyaB
MARNVEIKARVAHPRELESRAREIADEGPFDLAQDDTFFTCARGRLKLRELAPERGELIFYRREDKTGPKVSEYSIVATSNPAELRAMLSNALGVIGRVRKRRRLYLAGNTRIHLDEVEGLGSFLELEVVLSGSQTVADAEAVAQSLMRELGIPRSSLIQGAYLDLIEEQDGGFRAWTK